ncbi:MAG TPA: hypothetical protein VNN17_01170 [Terriglobia bacterium]|nr:hypothetical protein [Terriglobia bacterium]
MRLANMIVAALLLVTTFAAAQQTGAKAEEGTTRLTLQVLRESNREPVPDAHVVVRFTEERLLRRDKRVSWQAKTNRKGIIVLSDIPTGAVKVQVIAKGFRTYGEEHRLNQPQEELTILLQPPTGQVSAY